MLNLHKRIAKRDMPNPPKLSLSALFGAKKRCLDSCQVWVHRQCSVASLIHNFEIVLGSLCCPLWKVQHRLSLWQWPSWKIYIRRERAPHGTTTARGLPTAPRKKFWGPRRSVILTLQIHMNQRVLPLAEGWNEITYRSGWRHRRLSTAMITPSFLIMEFIIIFDKKISWIKRVRWNRNYKYYINCWPYRQYG